MESYGALRIALALFLPIAVRLLALRDAARSEPDAPCAALSARHLQVLRACGNRPMRCASLQYLAVLEWWRWLRRRSQRGLSWDAMSRLLQRYPLLTTAVARPA